MNPFEFQAELTRQWLGLATSTAQASAGLCMSLGRMTMDLWTAGAASRALPVLGAGGMPFPWPNAMPQMPIAGHMAAFGPQAQPWLMAAAWSPWSMMPFAPPTAMPWMWPWGAGSAVAAPYLSLFTPALHRRDPAAEIMESAATAYRSASGYAVATVLAPLNAALTPRRSSDQLPWWLSVPGSRSTH
ncbi:MAG: hypothetical protein SFW09_07775 [Hyphomicrobiaceae bacterium]|nr:hypothetical protein [Hyphomicrobiaceae bacterium]